MSAANETRRDNRVAALANALEAAMAADIAAHRDDGPAQSAYVVQRALVIVIGRLASWTPEPGRSASLALLASQIAMAATVAERHRTIGGDAPQAAFATFSVN